jgi:hypothetical protein
VRDRPVRGLARAVRVRERVRDSEGERLRSRLWVGEVRVWVGEGLRRVCRLTARNGTSQKRLGYRVCLR